MIAGGPDSVDCFANYYNYKLARLFSRFWNPNTVGVDFFIQPLRGKNCWVVLPVSIVHRVLHYMKSQNVVVTVILLAFGSLLLFFLLFATLI